MTSVGIRHEGTTLKLCNDSIYEPEYFVPLLGGSEHGRSGKDLQLGGTLVSSVYESMYYINLLL